MQAWGVGGSSDPHTTTWIPHGPEADTESIWHLLKCIIQYLAYFFHPDFSEGQSSTTPLIWLSRYTWTLPQEQSRGHVKVSANVQSPSFWNQQHPGMLWLNAAPKAGQFQPPGRGSDLYNVRTECSDLKKLKTKLWLDSAMKQGCKNISRGESGMSFQC